MNEAKEGLQYMADERPNRYVETDADGRETVVYRASSVGGCVRAMVAAARGIAAKPHQQWFQDVLDEGTRMEDEILQQYVTKFGVQLVELQPEVELVVGEIEGRRVIIRGHMDAIGEDVFGERLVVEAKKFRPSTYPKFEAKGVDCNAAYYPWQLSIYMYATNKSAHFVGGLYRPATPDMPEGIDRVEYHLYGVPPIALPAIKAKVAKVERLINEGYGADEVECSGNYPCGYWFLHDDQADGTKVAAVQLPQSEELAELIGKWRELAEWIKQENAIVKDLEASKKQLADKLREIVAAVAPGQDARKFTATVGGEEYAIAWTKSTVPAKTVKAYELDYFTVKAVKAAPQGRTKQ